MVGGGIRLARPTATLAGDLEACAAWDGAMAPPPRSRPTLLLLGEEDRMTPAARVVAGGRHRGRAHHILPGCAT
jgi:pimeloyl-ACP methyl ester carboxylesterase